MTSLPDAQKEWRGYGQLVAELGLDGMREFYKVRNASIWSDRMAGMSLRDLSKKHGLSHERIRIICLRTSDDG